MDIFAQLIREDYLSAVELKKQYEKEYRDSVCGKGLCSGMSRSQCSQISKMLREAIKDKEQEIECYRSELAGREVMI